MAELEWRDIASCSGYAVNSDGEVWSLERQITKRSGSGKEYVMTVSKKRLKPWRANAYLYCQLGASGPKTSVHRLVCFAFHGAPPKGFEVSHIDGNAENNRPENLEWVSHSGNEQQKKKHGTYARPIVFGATGQKKRGTKPSRHPDADLILALRAGGASIQAVADHLGVSKSGAANIISNRLAIQVESTN